MRVETLAEELFFTTVLLESHHADGSLSQGTAFVYTVDVNDVSMVQFLVTNKHVVDGAVEVHCHFLVGDGPAKERARLGERVSYVESAPARTFVGHPDPAVDVAVANISEWTEAILSAAGKHVFWRSLTAAHVPTVDSWEQLDALETVTFVGYPDGLYDARNFLPIARRGTAGTLPSVDYEGAPVFLIDASVFPGSSGSPVFVANAGSFTGRDGKLKLGNRLMLLGVIASVYEGSRSFALGPGVPALETKHVLNLGYVYKARTIDETVDVVLAQLGATRDKGSTTDTPT